MKFELEPSDIAAIADSVLKRLTPLLNDLKLVAAQTITTTAIQAIIPRENPHPKSEVVSAKDLQLLTGLSRVTIWRLENDKKFPARRHLSENRVGWLRVEVDAWLTARQKA